MAKHEHNGFVRWKHTWIGRAVWTIVDLVIAYIFASLAVDSGSLWQWGLVVLFLIDGLYNVARLIGLLINGRKTTETR
jgi:hypothetical protein